MAHVHRDELVQAHDAPARDRARPLGPKKKTVKPAKLWSAIAEANAAVLGAITIVESELPPLGGSMRYLLGKAEDRAVLEAIRGEPDGAMPLGVAHEGLRYHLVAGRDKGKLGAKIVAWWLATHGLRFGLDAYLASLRWHVGDYRDRTISRQEVHRGHDDGRGVVALLRGAIAEAPDDVYSAMLVLAQAARGQAELDARITLAELFPGEGFAEQDTPLLCETKRPFDDQRAIRLFRSMNDPQAAAQLAEFDYLTRELERAGLTLLARLGSAAEVPLFVLHQNAVASKYAILTVPAVEVALSRLGTERTAELATIVLLAGERDTEPDVVAHGVRADRRALWRDYLQRWPERLVPEFEALRDDARRGAAARALLDEIAALGLGGAPIARSEHTDAPASLRGGAPVGWSAPIAFRATAPPLVLRTTGRTLDAAERMRFVDLAVRSGRRASEELRAVASTLTLESLAGLVLDAAEARRACDRRTDRSPHDWVLGLAALGPSRELAVLLAGSASFEASISGGFAEARRLLGVLAEMGTDDAIERIGHLARRADSQGLRSAAKERLEALASRRGLSVPELEDSSAPTYGFDATGRATLAAGDERLSVQIDTHLQPVLVGPDGGLVEAPRTPELVVRFRRLGTDLEGAMRSHALRLERAMVEEQRWTAERFLALVSHPLLGLIAQRLLWASFSERPVFFRLDESRRPVSLDDTPLALDAAPIGVPHPLALPTDGRAAALFLDYQIVQPFPQIGRTMRGPADVEAALRGLQKKRVASASVRELLRRGFRRGSVDSAVLLDVERQDRGVRTLVRLDPGISVVDGKPAKVQIEPSIEIEPGASAIAVSEAVYELERL